MTPIPFFQVVYLLRVSSTMFQDQKCSRLSSRSPMPFTPEMKASKHKFLVQLPWQALISCWMLEVGSRWIPTDGRSNMVGGRQTTHRHRKAEVAGMEECFRYLYIYHIDEDSYCLGYSSSYSFAFKNLVQNLLLTKMTPFGPHCLTLWLEKNEMAIVVIWVKR